MNQNVVPPINIKNANSAILLEKLVDPKDKVCQLKKSINWHFLDSQLGYLFQNEHAPPSRLIFGLLYLQSISNLPYPDVIATWEKSPEWQYFCGEEFLNETFPVREALLSIWERAVGPEGRDVMTLALGVARYYPMLH